MKTRLALGLLVALILPVARAHADVGSPTLSWPYVAPASGETPTRFVYSVKYTNPANVPPDHVWVAMWWGSRGTRYWYEMSPVEPWNTNYANGAWYAFGIWGLDCSPHFYRFVAEVGTTLAYCPEPEGNYLSGPQVSGPPVAMGAVSASSASGPQPTVALQSDVTGVFSGGYVTFTAIVTLHATETQVAQGVTVAYTPNAMFTAVEGAAPWLIENSALLAWSTGRLPTPVSEVRLNGSSVPIFPAGAIFIAQCGDLAPGESAICTFLCRAN
jgi:hypothetical protein